MSIGIAPTYFWNSLSVAVIKLTRLNRQPIALNPDSILWAEQAPDTTLRLTAGESVIVLESIDEIIDLVIAFRRRIVAAVVPTRADVEVDT